MRFLYHTFLTQNSSPTAPQVPESTTTPTNTPTSYNYTSSSLSGYSAQLPKAVSNPQVATFPSAASYPTFTSLASQHGSLSSQPQPQLPQLNTSSPSTSTPVYAAHLHSPMMSNPSYIPVHYSPAPPYATPVVPQQVPALQDMQMAPSVTSSAIPTPVVTAQDSVELQTELVQTRPPTTPMQSMTVETESTPQVTMQNNNTPAPLLADHESVLEVSGNSTQSGGNVSINQELRTTHEPTSSSSTSTSFNFQAYPSPPYENSPLNNLNITTPRSFIVGNRVRQSFLWSYFSNSDPSYSSSTSPLIMSQKYSRTSISSE